MHSQFVKKSLVFAIATIAVVNGSPRRDLPEDGPNQPPRPLSPVIPNCGTSFPGTAEWNNCWATFHQSMNTFQQQMHNFGQHLSVSIPHDVPNGNFFTQSSFSSSMGSSHSNVRSNGYAIEASGIPISTSTKDNQIRITLTIGNVDSFETKTEGNDINFIMKLGGQDKWAKVTVPQGINRDEVKVERAMETVIVTGPTRMAEGNFNMMTPDIMQRRAGVPQANARLGRGRSMFAAPGFQQLSTFPEAQFEGLPQMWFL